MEEAKKHSTSMHTLKVQRIGDSLGIAFPAEILGNLKVVEGDTLWITETPEGLCVTASNTRTEAVLKAFAEVDERYSDAFQELAQ
jgi:putative addiction module antidote